MKFVMTSRLHITSLVGLTSWSAPDDLYKEGLDRFLSSQATLMVSLGLLSSKEILVLMQSLVVLIFLTSRISLTFNTDILRAHPIKHLLDLFVLWNESTHTRLQSHGVALGVWLPVAIK